MPLEDCFCAQIQLSQSRGFAVERASLCRGNKKATSALKLGNWIHLAELMISIEFQKILFYSVKYLGPPTPFERHKLLDNSKLKHKFPMFTNVMGALCILVTLKSKIVPRSQIQIAWIGSETYQTLIWNWKGCKAVMSSTAFHQAWCGLLL